MPCNANTAYQETMSKLKTVLDANYPSIKVEWPNVRNEKPEEREVESDRTDPWIRVAWQHIDSQQRTVGSANGARRYENFGLMTVSMYVPTGYGLTEISNFASTILNGFRGKTTTSGVVFLVAVPKEVGQEGNYFRAEALIDFQYDEIVQGG